MELTIKNKVYRTVGAICMTAIIAACMEEMPQENLRELTLTITGQSKELTAGEDKLHTVRILVYKEGILEKSIPYTVGEGLKLQDTLPYKGKYLGMIKIKPDLKQRTFYAVCNEQNLQLPQEGTTLTQMKECKWTQQMIPQINQDGTLNGKMPFTGGDQDTIKRIISSVNQNVEINIPVKRALARIDSLRFKKEDETYTARILSVKIYNRMEMENLMEKDGNITITDGQSIMQPKELLIQQQGELTEQDRGATPPIYIYENYRNTKPSGQWQNSGLPYLEIEWETNGVNTHKQIIPLEGTIQKQGEPKKTIYGMKRNYVYRAVFTVKDDQITGEFICTIQDWKEQNVEGEL